MTPRRPDRPDKKGFVTFLDESVRYEFRDLGPTARRYGATRRRISTATSSVRSSRTALKEAFPPGRGSLAELDGERMVQAGTRDASRNIMTAATEFCDSASSS